MQYPTDPRLLALFKAAEAAADAGHAVAVVAVSNEGAEHQFIDAGGQRLKVLGALDVVRADIVDDTPRDESNA